MKFKPTICKQPGAKTRAGFTLVEVLAALVFMAIIIPVTLQAISVASRAGTVGERKAAAARIAERVLNDLMVTGGLQQTSQTGKADEGTRQYKWTMRTEPWSEDAMSIVTVTVNYEVQGREYGVTVSTLFDPVLVATTTTSTR